MLAGLFSFSGRVGRMAYLGVGAIQISFLIVGFALMALMGKASGASPQIFLPILVMTVLLMWVGIAATVKRIRDVGWPILMGLLIVMFVPFASVLLLFWPGKAPDGPDPTVFSDDPTPSKPGKPKSSPPDWMERALGEISAARAPAPAPVAASMSAAPPQRFSHAYAPAPEAMNQNGGRATFGLRR